MTLGKRAIGFASIVAVGLMGAAALRIDAGKNFESARARYLENAHAAAEGHAKRAEDTLRSIYENVRTLTFLPSVRKIDRWATNLDEEGQATIQQVYNNLASNVAVSEVYVLPVDFDPDRRDARTGKLEAGQAKNRTDRL